LLIYYDHKKQITAQGSPMVKFKAVLLSLRFVNKHKLTKPDTDLLQ